MLKTIISLLCTLTAMEVFAQTVPSYIADWKNDAKGAYSIIHDDYGDTGVDGIWQYADTIAYNRGLKFTFGAISSSCENSRNINGKASPYAYAKDVMMDIHKHEIINHSHTHTCAVNRGWSPCGTTGWGELANTAAWNSQLHTSHNSILDNTGFQPRYYIYPYDQFTDAANTQLASMGYLGSRTGWHQDGVHSPFYKYGYEANDENLFRSNANGFFRTSVQVFDDVDAGKSEALQTAELNSVVDNVIANNAWGNRELHNVGTSGWGHVKVNAYRSHLNYVKTKVESGDLWMPTMSEILTYQIQKLVYNSSASYNSSSKVITVTFNTDNSIVTADVSTYLSGLSIKTPVTIVLNVESLMSVIEFYYITVKQDENTLTDVEFKDNKLFINAYPHNGAITIEGSAVLSNVIDRSNHKFEFYPNPVSDILTLKGEANGIEIYSVEGQKMLEVFGNQVDVSQLPSGLYYVSIKEKGSWQKIIKK